MKKRRRASTLDDVLLQCLREAYEEREARWDKEMEILLKNLDAPLKLCKEQKKYHQKIMLRRPE